MRSASARVTETAAPTATQTVAATETETEATPTETETPRGTHRARRPDGLRIDGCANLATTNTCSPLRGTCVEFLVDGEWTAAADVVGVTPTVVMVRSPFTCTAPTRARVRRARLDGGEVTSNELTICQN